MSESKLNKVLEKQLSKYGLSPIIMPAHLELWEKFILRISHHYNDLEQELYIMERSSAIASQETMALNKNLEDAQRLARMGRWIYNTNENIFSFTREFVTLFGLDPTRQNYTYQDVLQNVHHFDRHHFTTMWETALIDRADAECEVRIMMPEKRCLWFYILCRPQFDDQAQIKQISGIAMEITKRKEAEDNINKLNQELVVTARFSGMAEVATTMLHNLGNVLNSANISLNLISENLAHSYAIRLFKAVELIKSNLSSLSQYLNEDKKGQLLPQYLITSAELLKHEYEDITAEIHNLNIHLNHIKEIVSMQHNLSSSAKISEKIFLPELIDKSLLMASEIQFSDININKKYYDKSIYIETDQAKLLQILINLIQNAKDAINEVGDVATNSKQITICVSEITANQVKILVTDSGIGIEPENQTKIFAFGYTSKEKGHGFGLHSCALFAKVLGGNLQVNSEGIGKGTTFILSLPLSDGTKDNYEHR